MNKALNYKTSFRITIGNQFVGWVRSDASVNPAKDVVAVVADHSEQTEALLSGTLDVIDETASSMKFFLNGKPAKKGATVPFLGYLDVKNPSYSTVLMKLWPKLTFTNHAK